MRIRCVFILLLQLHEITLSHETSANHQSTSGTYGGLSMSHCEQHCSSVIPLGVDLMRQNNTGGNVKQVRSQGDTLVVVATKAPPYVNYLSFDRLVQEQMKYSPGVLMELLRQFAEQNKLRLQLIEANEHGELQPNGQWTGAMGYVQRQQVDVYASGEAANNLMIDVDFTFPFVRSQSGLAISSKQRRTGSHRFLIVLAPFSKIVWVTLTGTLVVSGAVLYWLSAAIRHAHGVEEKYEGDGALWVFFSLTVGQGLPRQPQSWAARTMLAFWWLAAVTLGAIFTGHLVALFAVETVQLPFKDLESLSKLLQRGAWQLAVTQDHLRRVTPALSRADPLLGAFINSNAANVRVVSSVNEGVKLVIEQPNTVLMDSLELLKFVASTECNMMVVDSVKLLPMWLAMPIRKDCPFERPLSKFIVEVSERGFIKKWLDQHKNRVGRESMKQCHRSTQIGGHSLKSDSIMGLDKAQGAFWLLITGCLTALVGFIVEKLTRLSISECVGCCCQKRNNHNDKVDDID